MKTITENRIKGIKGFRRAPEYDFTDDGSHFIGFEYKGLPLTQHRSSQYGTYLCFRVDYISHDKGFTYKDCSNTSWYHLCDKYNGVHCAFVKVCDEYLCPLNAQDKIYSLGGDTVYDLLSKIEDLECEIEDKQNRIEELEREVNGEN